MTHSIFQRFTFFLGLLIALLLAMPPLAYAEEEVRTDSIIQPLPLRLTPQWWNQFGNVNHRELKGRIEQLKRELNLINQPEEARNLTSQITALLDQYEAKRNTPLPVKEAVKNEEKRLYYLDDIFHLIQQQKSTESDLQLLKANIDSLAKEIKVADVELNKIKLRYLKYKDVDTDKLTQGLKWIKARLNLSLLGISQTSMLSQEELLNKTIEALREEKQSALDLIEVTQKQIQDSKLRGNLLEDKIKEVSNDLQRLKNTERSITVVDDASTAKKRLLSLQVLETSAHLRKLTTEHLTYLLIKDIDLLKNNSSETARSNIRKHLSQGITHIKETTKWMEEAGNRVEKEENAVNSLQALDNNKAGKKHIKQRLTALRKVYQQGVELESKQEKLKLLTTILDDQLGKTAQGAAILVEKADETLRKSWGKVTKWMSASLFSLSGTPVTPLGILHFLTIIFLGWLLSRLLSHTIERVNSRTHGGMQTSSVKTLSRIISFVLIGIALLIGFSSLGIDVTKLALVASALSIGVGFGLQNIINNFVSGIILMFERSMKVGDYIELADGMRGEVREINIRSTVINTNNNIDVIVPNSEFVNSSVTNWTMNERFLRIKIPFGVAYGSDKELVRRIVIDAALSLPYTLNLTERQYPQVRLAAFGDSSLDFELVVWIKAEWANRPGRVKAAYNWEIETTLGNHNVEIPFPQRELRILRKEAIDLKE
ncbi:MAG TPA: mechanosensitive ion channel [Leucothrix mucor]|nr:mechanosensitive ion channel [Leucothrix mucor]